MGLESLNKPVDKERAVLTLRIRFPAGRYHATPWGFHVNEGHVEWPPSPWRLLRALLASGFTTQHWSEVPKDAKSLVGKLAAYLPYYRLPKASLAHSRHYMLVPEGAKMKSTLVFDTWANVDEDIEICWPCELDHTERGVLEKLVAGLGYLGRSESWVDAELVLQSTMKEDWSAKPCEENGTTRHTPGHDWEQVSLMAAMASEAYDAWRKEAVKAIEERLPKPEGKKKLTKKQEADRAKVLAPYPSDLIDCLMKDTAWWKGFGWSQPPGSRCVLYWRRKDLLEVHVPPRRRPLRGERLSTMLLALTTPSGNQSALPSIVRTLPQAELLHRAIVARLGKGLPIDCPDVTGKDTSGKPLQEGHRHAHVLPVDLDADGHLDHILLYAPMGFGPESQQAIRTLRRTWTKGGIGELQLAVVGEGNLEMLRQLPSPLSRGILRLLGKPGVSRVWESCTPFVPPRHLKKRGENSLDGQVRAEFASRGFQEPESIEFLDWNENTNRLRHFVRQRKRSSVVPPVDVVFGLRLRFAKPFEQAPIAIGFGSHFGLGMFGAVDID